VSDLLVIYLLWLITAKYIKKKEEDYTITFAKILFMILGTLFIVRLVWR
jgi:hypothetical protein